MTNESFKRLRVAIIGGCQAAGLSLTAQRLLPGALVKNWHVGVVPNDTDEELLAQLPEFDLVISQLPDWDWHVPLRITRLRELGLPVIYLPTLAFQGFHPDLTYLAGAPHYHSVIVASAFTLGLPERRVPELFNAFIFAELGYFDVFDAAKAALIAEFGREGFNLEPLFDLWMRQVGQFMYTINHPHILALSALCHLALARAGYIDPATPLPDDIYDYLATHFVWPVYPALGKRIGVPGSTTFLRYTRDLLEGQKRELPLIEYVAEQFHAYRGLEKDALRTGPVADACERISTLLV
jgi:hypothetical protein